MTPHLDENRSAVLAATVTAAAGIAFQVGSKATRDALFLSSFGVESLPAMIMATSLLAIGFAFLSAGALTAWGPGRVIPGALAGSGVLLLVEWAISLWFPRAAAVLVYLHCGCLGGLLISGFWSLINERFDPRTAKRHLGPITAWGTFGGALGGLIAARVGQTEPVSAMLPILAAFHFLAAAAAARVGLGARPVLRAPRDRDADGPRDRMRSGLSAIARSDYLRGLVGLVVLVTISEGFLDIVLKTRAASAFGGGGALLRFFAVFYTLVSVVTLLFQAAMSRVVLEKLGPARTAAVLPMGVTVAAAGAFVGPGLWTAALARGAESILSNSVFRGGYEVLFTPVAAREKRAVKPLADVGAARVGDLVAAAIAQGVLAVSLFHAPAILTSLALVVSVAAAFAAFRLGGGYVRSLERGLRSRAIELDLSEVRDATTRIVMMRTLDPLEFSRILPAARGAAGPATKGRPEAPHAERIGAFRSSDPVEVRKSLRSAPVTAALVPEVMSLLAWDDVAKDAIEILREAGPTAIEPLIAGLLDPREEFAIRRRIPLILATYVDPRALDGLSHGLGDRRFEVRYRCGRGLSHLTELEPSLTVAPPIVTEAVLREVEAGAGIWEGRRLLDQYDDELWSPVVDDAIRARANKSLEHVFTLLALILPRQPLRIAFRGLHAEDAFLRGTALEYLESALPQEIRKPLWPYLEDRRPRRPQAARPTEEALARLIQSSESIVIHLDELRRKSGPPQN